MNQNETIRINLEIDDRDLRNLNNVISDLQTTLDDLNRTLKDSISQVQNTVREFSFFEEAIGITNGMFDTLVRTLSVSTMTFKNLDDNIKFLTGTKNAFTTATNASRAATDKKTTSLWLASAAATGLKWTMKALPFVGIAVAIGSLVTTIMRWAGSTNDTADATQNLENRLANLRNEFEGNRQSHDSTIRSIRAHNQTMNDLIDTVIRLSGNTGNSAEKQNELMRAVDLLNLSTSDYTLILDETTFSLMGNSDEVLENMRNYHNLNGAMGESEAILEELISHHSELNYATSMVEELEQTYTDLYETMGNYRNRIDEISTIMPESSAQYRELREEQNNLEEAYSQTAVALKELSDDLEVQQEALYETQKSIQGLEYQLDSLARNTVESMNLQSMSYETMTESQRAVVDGFRSMYEIGSSRLSDLTRAFKENTDLTWERIQYNNRRITAATAEHAELYAYFVSQGISTAFLSAIGADSAEALPLLREMQSAGIDYVRDEQSSWKDAHENNANTIIDAFDFNPMHEAAIRNYMIGGLRDTLLDTIEQADFPEIGEMLPAGIIEGVKAGEADAIATLSELAESLGVTVKELLGINSPSRVFKGYGENIIQGLVRGLHELRSEPTDRLQTLACNMQRVYNSSQRDYAAIGRDIVNGLNEGLLNREGTVMATAQRIANNIARTMQRALQINSPSRVMREQIGRHIPSGVAAGIDKYADIALDSVDKLASDMVKITIPSVESIIGMRPSLSMAGAGGFGSSSHDNRVINNNQGLFDGATINWHGEEDIRHTMEKIAWATEREKARMW